MTATATRKQIRDRLRKRVGAAADTYFTDAELDPEIDASAQEYFDMVITAYPEDHFTKFEEFTTTATTEKYPLATTVTNSNDDLYILRRVQVKDANVFADLDRFSIPDYAPLTNTSISGDLDGLRYALIGTDLYLLPEHAAGLTVRVWYVPTFTKFVDDAATVDGINGWEEYVVLDLGIKYRESQRQSTATFERQKAAMAARITALARRRHLQPRRIIVRNHNRGLSARP